MTKRFELSMYYWFMVGSIIFIIDGATHNLFPVGVFYFLTMILESEGFLQSLLGFVSVGFWVYSLVGKEEKPVRIVFAQGALVVSLIAYLTSFPGSHHVFYYFSFIPFLVFAIILFRKCLIYLK